VSRVTVGKPNYRIRVNNLFFAGEAKSTLYLHGAFATSTVHGDFAKVAKVVTACRCLEVFGMVKPSACVQCKPVHIGLCFGTEKSLPYMV
jgi:hypothetical protein